MFEVELEVTKVESSSRRFIDLYHQVPSTKRCDEDRFTYKKHNVYRMSKGAIRISLHLE